MIPKALPMKVAWLSKDANGELYRLHDLLLHTVRGHGVYVLYQTPGILVPLVLRIGKGDFTDRFQDHRNNPAIAEYRRKFGPVYVTWALVTPLLSENVERYLADLYGPKIGDAFPDVVPVSVNLPFAA